jgi:methylated-DNA-[protein]-cysteine S-methyltransferase
MEGIAYIESPLGSICIKDNGTEITTIHFMEEKEKRVLPQPSAITLEAAKQLSEYFEGTRKLFDFQFAQQGTAFQQKVWNKLLEIPLGKTITYLDLARQLNDEKCIRAAASANGKNSLAILVPCHRVIGTDGKLVGYAGGLWRKKWLLNHEANMTGKQTQGTLF